jgi:hypothetical protein
MVMRAHTLKQYRTYYLDRINKETDPNKVKSLQAEANKAMTTC